MTISQRKVQSNILRLLKPTLLGLLTAITILGLKCYSQEPHKRVFASNDARVVDGDTIVLDKTSLKRKRIRLQGIDAPELG